MHNYEEEPMFDAGLQSGSEAADEAVEDDVEVVDRVEVDAVLEEAVDATLAAVRRNILQNASDERSRKAIPVLTRDRRKVRRRNADTDVPVSDLVFDAVLELLHQGVAVEAVSSRAAKNRTERITLTAPTWWWQLVTLAAEANGAQPADVIAEAINKHLA